VVDIYHPYLAIFGRGFMNKLDAAIRQQFLCMKIPAPKGVITVFDNQQEPRNIEKGHTPGQANVYQLKTAEERKEPYEEAKRVKEKIEIAADGETKKVYLNDMPDRAVTIGAHLNPEEEKELTQFLTETRMFSHGQPKTCKVLTGTSLNMLRKQMKEYLPRNRNFRKCPKKSESS
jgi:hypothetical protein